MIFSSNKTMRNSMLIIILLIIISCDNNNNRNLTLSKENIEIQTESDSKHNPNFIKEEESFAIKGINFGISSSEFEEKKKIIYNKWDKKDGYYVVNGFNVEFLSSSSFQDSIYSVRLVGVSYNENDYDLLSFQLSNLETTLNKYSLPNKDITPSRSQVKASYQLLGEPYLAKRWIVGNKYIDIYFCLDDNDNYYITLDVFRKDVFERVLLKEQIETSKKMKDNSLF